MKQRLLAFLLIFMMSAGLMTTVLPREKAEAAIAFLYDKKKPQVILTTKKAKEIFVGGKAVELGYNIGGIKKGVNGKWTSSKTSVVKVSKNGKVTAVGNGSAIVSFKYKAGNREISIRSKFIAKTRASAITLVPQNDFNGKMIFGSINEFRANMSTNPKALRMNSSVKHSYKVFYELFMDAELKNPAPLSLAKISDNGIFTAGNEVGTVYLRAVGKLSKNSKNGIIYSSPIAITIEPKLDFQSATILQTALNKFDVYFDQAEKITGIEIRDYTGNTVIGSVMSLSEDKKVLTVTADKNLTKSAKIILKAGDKKEERLFIFSDQKVSDIQLIGEEADLIKFENNKGRAEIAFRLLDQFGADVTFDKRFVNKSYALWMNKKADISQDGRISFDLTPEQSVVGYTGALFVKYAPLDGSTVEKSFAIKIGNFRIAKEIKVEGIFKKLTSGYVKVLDRDGTMPVGAVLGNHVVEGYTDSFAPHYLLIKVTDSSGKTMAEIDVNSKRYEVSIHSGTGIEIDKLGKNDIHSISPVIIGGERFLTYPLKQAVLKEGDVIIKVAIPGTKIKDLILAKVAKESGSGNLMIEGEGTIDMENLILFTLYNSNNEKVTKYEEVLSTLGLMETAANQAFVPLDSTIIRSANSSIFIFKKNLESGKAELYYRPNVLSLPAGRREFIEEIVVLKGTQNENSFTLKVKSK